MERIPVADAHELEVAVPMVPYGPDGIPQAEADARYYRLAARNIRHRVRRGDVFAGSNLSESVARLCAAAADALDRKPSNQREDSDA